MERNAFASCIAPTAQDWEERRPQITQLYLNEDKPLKDVMTSINVGGFKGTKKMFKSRITKWGLDKKTKEREARAILKKHAERNGRPTKILLRGQSVNISKIEHYFKRKGISIEDVLSSASSPPSEMNLVCRSPSPVTMIPRGESLPTMATTTSVDMETMCRHDVTVSKTIPPRIEAPDALKVIEYMYINIQEYIASWAKASQTPESSSKIVTGVAYNLRYRYTETLPCAVNNVEDLPAKFELSYFQMPNQKLSNSTARRKDIAESGWLGLLSALSTVFPRNVHPFLPAFIAKALDSKVETEHSVIYPMLGRILHSLTWLFQNSQPLALIASSIVRVVKDNVKYFIGDEITIHFSYPGDRTRERVISLDDLISAFEVLIARELRVALKIYREYRTPRSVREENAERELIRPLQF